MAKKKQSKAKTKNSVKESKVDSFKEEKTKDSVKESKVDIIKEKKPIVKDVNTVVFTLKLSSGKVRELIEDKNGFKLNSLQLSKMRLDKNKRYKWKK